MLGAFLRNINNTFLFFIHSFIRKCVGNSILFTIYMCKYYLSSPVIQKGKNLTSDHLQSLIFYLIVSGKLLDHELRVSTKFDLSGSLFDGVSNPKKCSSIFRNIIRRETKIRIGFFYRISFFIADIDTTSSGPRISSRTPIGIDDIFRRTHNK